MPIALNKVFDSESALRSMEPGWFHIVKRVSAKNVCFHILAVCANDRMASDVIVGLNRNNSNIQALVIERRKNKLFYGSSDQVKSLKELFDTVFGPHK